MWKKAGSGVIILSAMFFIMFTVLTANFFCLAYRQEYVLTAAENSFITVSAGDSQGTVYDRNMCPLTGNKREYTAVVVPCGENDSIADFAVNRAEFMVKNSMGKPFSIRCKKPPEESESVTVFDYAERYSENQVAQHIIGYISDGKGVSGIEYAYDRLLRGGNCENTVTYSADGFGNILIGNGKSVIKSTKEKTGIVLTIDGEIQKICEECGKNIEKGAIVVSDVKNGDIIALASFPKYSVYDLDSALSDERCPLINRCFYSYSVGSVFKLLTACEGINEKFGGYVYDCKGDTDISGQHFSCHNPQGHGIQTMKEAMVNSCNPYFINLSKVLDTEKLRKLAYNAGFGKEIYLCAGMTASAGVLPTVDELMIPAELANFSFGQGKLSAAPLQINQFTAAIANEGQMPVLRLIKGITVDGESVGNEKNAQRTKIMEKETADILSDMMQAAVYENKNSNARPDNVRVAAKTSTAQTGRFDESGEEYCNAWITGFFPTDKPVYAITVLVEDGGYGNDKAAPIFRDIINKIYENKKP